MTDLLARRARPGQISRVPHLPGLDGLRAIAVVAVMLYHADKAWLHGGFLGVEVFFVISGYLITLLLIAEHERNGHVSLGQFWLRRARRLLPALFVMLALVIVYLAAFEREAQGRTRGDIVAGIAYVSNWYQIWVGAGYTAAEAFVPLRHLWSLAVEEQFYLIWPLVMVAILARGRANLPRVALWLVGVSLAITAAIAILYVPGDIGSACTVESTRGYWEIGTRCISVNDTLYLGTITRAGGLMLGAAFAMVWRPVALMRGPMRSKGRHLDVLAVLGAVLLGLMMWITHLADQAQTILTGSRFDPLLFRGGLFVTGLATVMIIAATTHQRAATGRLLGNPLFTWIGTRSYGLYLFHWPVYQAIREQAGEPLEIGEFVLAMAITIPITELSYRFVEMPVRRGRLGEWFRPERFRMSASADQQRRRTLILSAVAVLAVVVAGASVALAPNRCVGAIECASAAGIDAPSATTLPPTGTSIAGAAPSVAPTLPGSTIAGQTTAPSTSAPTTLPPEVPYFALGESVMLGARPNLEAAGIRTDAAENRGPNAALEALQAFRTANRLTRAAVIQIGTNGPVTQAQYDAILAELSDLNLVVVLTVKAPLPYIPGNNAIIRALPATHPNVIVLDWEARAVEVLNGLSSSDGGVHLNTAEAKTFYTNIILQALGLA